MNKAICILLSMCFLICGMAVSVSAVSTERSYNFFLASNCETEILAEKDDIITVTLTLDRTDVKENADMYAMQSEIVYDTEFFSLVDGSIMTSNEINTEEIKLRDGRKALYFNFLSLSGGEEWEPHVNVGSFQLEVLSDGGTSSILAENCIVTTENGEEYSSECNDLTVQVNADCLITFEENGGSEVSDQTVKCGEKIKEPKKPTKEGYQFKGWYSDFDCEDEWDFSEDTVDGNMTLYALWGEGILSGGFSWWLIPVIIVLAGALTFVLVKQKKAKEKK